jgi:hypothetical protein
MKKYLLDLPDEIHKAFKQLATENDLTIKSLLIKSVEDLYGKEFTKYLTK